MNKKERGWAIQKLMKRMKEQLVLKAGLKNDQNRALYDDLDDIGAYLSNDMPVAAINLMPSISEAIQDPESDALFREITDDLL